MIRCAKETVKGERGQHRNTATPLNTVYPHGLL